MAHKVKGQGHQAALLSAALTHEAGACNGDRENVFGVGNYCYVASARLRVRRLSAHGKERGGHIVAAFRLQLFFDCISFANRLSGRKVPVKLIELVD